MDSGVQIFGGERLLLRVTIYGRTTRCGRVQAARRLSLRLHRLTHERRHGPVACDWLFSGRLTRWHSADRRSGRNRTLARQWRCCRGIHTVLAWNAGVEVGQGFECGAPSRRASILHAHMQ